MSEVVTLTHPNGSQARILISQGFNCFEWRFGDAQSGSQVLYADTNFASGDCRPSSGGIPILFPFPGRLRGQIFTYDGRDYSLEGTDALGNAIHGFCHTRPWRVLAQEDSKVTATFSSLRDAPELKNSWPCDFEVRASYELEAIRLRFSFEVQNVGSQDLPFGLGLHPYFRLGVWGASPTEETLQVPVTTHWPLQDMLPTGESQADPWKLREGISIGQESFDDVFSSDSRRSTSQTEGSGTIEANAESDLLAHLQGPERELQLRYGSEFPVTVVYTPPHREAICIEPYSCLPNSPDWVDSLETGWQLLKSGDSWRTQVDYSVNE